eukprot:8205131-Pyramimonas_sp.AAC.2
MQAEMIKASTQTTQVMLGKHASVPIDLAGSDIGGTGSGALQADGPACNVSRAESGRAVGESGELDTG